MAYDVVLTSRAKRELDRMPREVFLRIDPVLRALQVNPRPYGVQKLEEDLHRIRIGDWRILFLIHDQARRVIVIRITRRSEKTYKHLS